MHRPGHYKLVVMGDGGVGKTALSIMFTANHFVEQYDPTIEDSYRRQLVIDGEACIAEVLDTAGQEEFSALRDQWIRESEAYLLVYSITSRDSFVGIHTLRTAISRAVDKDDVPIILVANKCDLEDHRQVSVEEGQKLAASIGARFFEVSAKRRIAVDQCFEDGIRLIRKYRNGGEENKKKKDLKKLRKRDACRIL